MKRVSRRRFLTGATTALLGLPLAMRLGRAPARAADPATAKRIVFFYFPDGIVGPSQAGQPTLWHPSGTEHQFALTPQLEALAPYKDRCVFLNGLSSGPTDSGSHPGGAKKLLTAADGGQGESLDQLLARTVGAASPHRLVYLGAMANHNGASGDKHLSYPQPGQTIAPEDNPVLAFERLFGAPAGARGGGGPDGEALRRLSVLDLALGDIKSLQARLGATESAKLALHYEALREVELRIQSQAAPPVAGTGCESPSLDAQGLGAGVLYEPERFPTALRLQTELMVQAMACGLTRVGVIQASHHTSELIMSRFAGTEMYDPGFDMRSHQASHYGSSHDEQSREFVAYRAQRRWFVAQFAYLLGQLAARPEGEGTMLDHTVCLLMSEVADGNTHLHDNLPLVVAGGAGGRISGGRLLDFGYRRHADLLVSLAQVMGQPVTSFGEGSSGPLPGLVSAG
jgi:hypothetical protein